MKVAKPHYLLFSESCRKSPQGQWRFVLQSLDGAEQFEAADAEPDARGERLELLAVVRGLEALAQPSRVTLVTPSRYVNRGLTYGLAEWRVNDWRWEHYGEMVPVKNRDLWQRVDRALEFHQLDCRTWRFDPPHLAAHELEPEAEMSPAKPSRRRPVSLGGRLKRRLVACERWWDDHLRSLGLWSAQCGTQLLPPPWLQ
ncbi:MAG: RNase H family protein [Pirellulales bacterium]